jgi:hypothetical protein
LTIDDAAASIAWDGLVSRQAEYIDYDSIDPRHLSEAGRKAFMAREDCMGVALFCIKQNGGRDEVLMVTQQSLSSPGIY